MEYGIPILSTERIQNGINITQEENGVQLDIQ